MLVAFTLPARADLLLNEPFDYPVATVLDDAATPWLADASLGDYIQVVANNLSVPGLAPPSGRSVQYGGGGRSSSRTFGTQTSGTLYYSLALRLDNTNFTDQDIAAALRHAHLDQYRGRLLARSGGRPEAAGDHEPLRHVRRVDPLAAAAVPAQWHHPLLHRSRANRKQVLPFAETVGRIHPRPTPLVMIKRNSPTNVNV